MELYGVEAIKDSEVTKSLNDKGKYDTIHKNIFMKYLSNWENMGGWGQGKHRLSVQRENYIIIIEQ